MSNEWSAETLYRLRGKAISLGVKRDDLEDFTQTIATYAVAHFDPARSSLDTYLNRLAGWFVKSYYRDKAKETQFIQIVSDEGNDRYDEISRGLRGGAGPRSHEELRAAPAQEHAAALNEILVDPEAAQTILFAEGWSCADIGTVRHVSRETVRKEIAAYRRNNAARYGMNRRKTRNERAAERSRDAIPANGKAG